jgi:glutathione S-transferase
MGAFGKGLEQRRPAMTYQLFYWPNIPGRGEFVRLALEAAGADYVDVARQDEASGGGVPALLKAMSDPANPHPPYAPPFLVDGAVTVAQSANILLYLGVRLGLAPEDEVGRLWLHQVQLTVADLVSEAHDVHHPVGSGLYYEDQKPEAARAAAGFLKERTPKFMGWFETVLRRNGGAFMVGQALTYADTSLFHVVEGLRYAFPRATARQEADWPGLVALCDRVADHPKVAAYLASDRRIPENEMGIFRHYPELDG